MVFPRKEHTNFLSRFKQSALKTYIQIQHTDRVGYIRNICIYMYLNHTKARRIEILRMKESGGCWENMGEVGGKKEKPEML